MTDSKQREPNTQLFQTQVTKQMIEEMQRKTDQSTMHKLLDLSEDHR